MTVTYDRKSTFMFLKQCNDRGYWQWMWLCWYSGRFRNQRSEVQIRSLANIYFEQLFTVNCNEKTKIKKKRAGLAHLKNQRRRRLGAILQNFFHYKKICCVSCSTLFCILAKAWSSLDEEGSNHWLFR